MLLEPFLGPNITVLIKIWSFWNSFIGVFKEWGYIQEWGCIQADTVINFEQKNQIILKSLQNIQILFIISKSYCWNIRNPSKFHRKIVKGVFKNYVDNFVFFFFYSNTKYLLRRHILDVLMHTTTWDWHGGGSEILKWVLRYVAWLCLA